MRLSFASQDEVTGRKKKTIKKIYKTKTTKRNEKQGKGKGEGEAEGRLGRLRHTTDIVRDDDADVYWWSGMRVILVLFL